MRKQVSVLVLLIIAIAAIHLVCAHQSDSSNEQISIAVNQPLAPLDSTLAGDQIPGNSKTKVYHKPSCTWAGKIKPENLVWFSSYEEAKSSGYRACQKCKPP